MKVCPACDRTYHDDELNFCLMCGTSLVEGASQPTVVIPAEGEVTAVIAMAPTVADPNKRGIGFWIAVTVTCIVGVSGASFGGLFLYFLFTGDGGRSANPNRNRKGVAAAKTPLKPQATPVATPTPDDERDETSISERVLTKEIEWATTAISHEAEYFARESFSCPPDGSEYAVFGNDIYASNSSICTAAVHAGKITFEKGGEVTIIFDAGLSSYVTSTRNGITTNMFGSDDSSFVFE